MKLALGTVQLGMQYGIKNSSGIPVDQEIEDIFAIAADWGINTLDTAVGYGRAEEQIGKFSKGRFNVISKLPAFAEGYSFSWLSETVDSCLCRLRSSKLYGLLLHKPEVLLTEEGHELYHGLEQLKKDGIVDKIGISVYTPQELEGLLEFFSFDIVQVPLNILDRSFLQSGSIAKLHELGVEIHTRSIFLQGLLLMPPAERPGKFKPWTNLLSKYDQWLAESNLTALEACLRFALSIPEISKVIVGVDSSNQLRQIAAASVGNYISIPTDISSDDAKLINPSSWIYL